MEEKRTIKAIIGLGNPGPKYQYTRHNAGFLVVDALAEKHHASWQTNQSMQICTVSIQGHSVLLVKPMTFMNTSGVVIPFLQKKGIKPQEVVVVHDELEKKPGTASIKVGGSHRGHNGVRSIIAAWGDDFLRVRIGIGRPENKDAVDKYVLQNFDQSPHELQEMIDRGVLLLEELCT